MLYRCRSGSQCKDTFTTERGLNLHRKTCNYYKRYEAAAFAKRKSVAEQKKMAVMNKRTKGKGKEDGNIAGFGSVSLPLCPIQPAFRNNFVAWFTDTSAGAIISRVVFNL
jgi:hypothetical protein